MKKLVVSSVFVLTILNMTFAQLTRTGSFVAGTALYPISGDVTVTSNAGTITVEFENNFSTIQGIRLEVFLGKSKNLNTGTDLKISTVPLDDGTAMSSPITGTRTFAVPAGTNLYEYDNVIVQCTVANVLWGHANLCESTLNLSTSPLPTDLYRGEQSILSSSVIDNAADVSFEAQNMIVLDSDFEVPSSSNFDAVVGSTRGCIIE